MGGFWGQNKKNIKNHTKVSTAFGRFSRNNLTVSGIQISPSVFCRSKIHHSAENKPVFVCPSLKKEENSLFILWTSIVVDYCKTYILVHIQSTSVLLFVSFFVDISNTEMSSPSLLNSYALNSSVPMFYLSPKTQAPVFYLSNTVGPKNKEILH